MTYYIDQRCVRRGFLSVRRWLLGTLAISFILVAMNPGAALGQRVMVRAGADESIDNMTKAAIIDSVAKALNDVYVFPDVAKKMEKQIRHNLRAKAYDKLGTYGEFTGELTDDLFEISNDKHLSVRYSPEEDLFRQAPGDTLTEEEERQLVESMAYMNFGFMRLERMPGNVGYLELQGFQNAKWAGKTAVAAMNFLANCDAVIIDLRKNGGGDPSMIQLISSYFFDEPVHLNSFYIRDEDKTQQFWSHAHVEGPRMTDVDLYILTSPHTFSAAEEFTYNMKNLKRATIIGETTGGGAHPVRFVRFADLKITMSLPFGRAINPITGTNWEGTGIEPDIQVPEARALETAHLEAMTKLADKATGEERKRDLEWAIADVSARNNPASIAAEVMQRYAGTYGPRTITYDNGDLYYQRGDNPQMRMIPMSDDTFMFDEVSFFRLKIELDGEGSPVALIGIYNDGHTDRSPRSEDQ